MDHSVKTELQERYYLLDAVRGVCILGMIIYHTLFDVVAFFGVEISYSMLNFINMIRDFGACCFIALAGICIHFGKRPLKRAMTISVAGLIVSAVTFIAMPELPIIFGILTFMGAASFLMIPMKRFLEKLPAGISAVLCFILFLLTFNLTKHCLGFYSLEFLPLPEFLYRNYLTAFFGFPFYGFASSDYYPVFPWIFMFLFGFFLWPVMKKSRMILKLLSFRLRFFEKIGRVSLYIYMIHQPVILGILMLISLMIGG